MFEKTERFCRMLVDSYGIPGVDLSVYVGGSEAERFIYGYSDCEKTVPMNGKERLYIFSCSKFITCAVLMNLWEKGMFSLDDPLSKYLPEYGRMKVAGPDGTVRDAEKPILIRHLFTMTAGLTYNLESDALRALRKDTDGVCPLRKAAEYIAREPLLFEPGERWEYSLCHDVLAALGEVLTGEDFETLARRIVFDPLGMKNTSYLPVADPEREGILPACSYEKGRSVRIPGGNMYVLGTGYLSGGAGCVSSVEDYMLFLEAVRKGTGPLSEKTVKLMSEDLLSDAQKIFYFCLGTHGYGLGIRTPLEGGLFTDIGWGGAAGAYMATDPGLGISLYYSQNVLSSPAQKVRRSIYAAAVAEITGDERYADYVRSTVMCDGRKVEF